MRAGALARRIEGPSSTVRGPGRAVARPDHAAVLQLQRNAGNRAVAGLLSSTTPVVQRHSSHEHAMMGDRRPSDIGAAEVSRDNLVHVIGQEMRRTAHFADDVGAGPMGGPDGYRWVQFKASGLWATYGELNALADYLPDPTAADTMPRDQLARVLQSMRVTIYRSLAKLAAAHGVTAKELEFDQGPGAVARGVSMMSEAAGDAVAMDGATSALGSERYKGLLTRNACHFAPFSWERFRMFHNQALGEAHSAYLSRQERVPLDQIDNKTEEHTRQAVLFSGYADHFIQDSFAAGHLINKTLVMQWFVDYINSMSWIDQPWVGRPSYEVMKHMGSAKQPGMAGRSLYQTGPNASGRAGTSADDRASGRTTIDPQSAEERADKAGRIAGSGVVAEGSNSVEQSYQIYLEFLNSVLLQKAAGFVHDHFNAGGADGKGTTVRNSLGQAFVVGGDDTYVEASDRLGAELAATAAEKSRRSVEETVLNGYTKVTSDEIFALVPATVVSGGVEFGLEAWQDEVLHELCITKLFPDYLKDADTNVRFLGADMVSGGSSIDSPEPSYEGFDQPAWP